MSSAASGSGQSVTSQRLDKWLWHARLAKSRTLASKFVEEGKIRVNREKVHKPSHTVKPGDVLTATIHGHLWIVKVKELVDHRVSASEAVSLYEDLTPPEGPALPGS
jgi:ribosome-associated heat shock protein Hsp15